MILVPSGPITSQSKRVIMDDWLYIDLCMDELEMTAADGCIPGWMRGVELRMTAKEMVVYLDGWVRGAVLRMTAREMVVYLDEWVRGVVLRMTAGGMVVYRCGWGFLKICFKGFHNGLYNFKIFTITIKTKKQYETV